MNTPHTKTQGSKAESHASSGLPLKVGRAVAFVDACDFPLVSRRPWWIKRGYAYTTGGVAMHMLIARPAAGRIVDHANGDTLDNRRCNLRACTVAQNSRNKKRKATSSAPYKGITKTKSGWSAQIECSEKHVHLGIYNCPVVAALSYDTAARYLFQSFARCNFESKQIPFSDLPPVSRLKLRLLRIIQSEKPNLAA